LIYSRRPRPVPVSQDAIGQVAQPIRQHVVRAGVPVDIVGQEHELVSRLAIPSGDVVGEGLADDVVCSQRAREGVFGCAPVAEEGGEEVCVLAG
jgi:hypothetical protein